MLSQTLVRTWPITVVLNLNYELCNVKVLLSTVGYHVFVSRVPPQANAQNAFKEWHVAFHGTASQNVRKILDTGGLVVHGECELCKLMYYLLLLYTGTVASDTTPDQIVVSPSIKYTDCEKFSKCKP